MSRPTDIEIANYIESLESVLATDGYPAPGWDSNPTVHRWAGEVLHGPDDDEAPEEPKPTVKRPDMIERQTVHPDPLERST